MKRRGLITRGFVDVVDTQRPGFDLVLKFFEGNEAKARLWYTLSNPAFGHVSPDLMILVGRGEKVLRMIQDAATAEATARGLPPPARSPRGARRPRARARPR